MQNSNPTILTELPSREPATLSDPGLYDGDIFGGVASNPLPPQILSSTAKLSLYSGSEFDSDEDGDLTEDPIDEQEIYDLVATISDPEHPLSLGSLAVVSLPDISIKPSLPNRPNSPLRTVTVLITPTITHCSLATVIGLGVRVRLEQSLSPRFRVDVRIKEGTHSTAEEVNKQLCDKERVAAALENGTLMGVIGKMLETCE